MPVKVRFLCNWKKLALALISGVGGLFATLAWYLSPTYFADWEYAHLLTNNTNWDRLIANFQLGLQLPPLIILITCTLLGASIYYYCFSQLLTKRITQKNLVISSLVALAITLALITLGNYRQQPSFTQLADVKTLLRFVFKYLFLADFILALGITIQIFFQTTFQKLTSTRQQLIKLILMALFLEVVVFNFPHHTSILYQPQPLTNPIAGENNLEFSDTNKYVITDSKSTFEFTNLNTHIDNICFDFHHTQAVHHPLQLEILATDEGFSQDYPDFPKKHLAVGYPTTQCVRVHLSGITTKLKIKLISENGTELGLTQITINQPVSFHFFLSRFLITMIVLASFSFLSPAHPNWKLRLASLHSREKMGKFAVIVVLMIGHSLIAITAANFQTELQPWETNPHEPIINDPLPHLNHQYQELAVAFSRGRLDLGMAPDCLNSTSNPYDTTIRFSACENNRVRFDTAYYRPYYYVYFGITPVLLLYLPYYLLTGLALPNWVAVATFSTLFCLGVFYFFHGFIKRLFPRTPWLLYLLVCELVIFSAGLGIFADTSLYLVPIIAVAACATAGLALLENKHYLLGSFLLALVAGCRPQLLLFSFAVIIYYLYPLIKNKTLWQPPNRSLLLKLAIPFMIVGAGLMAYNYVRFDSPFDFGANYNLTASDMTHYGVVLAKLPPVLYRFFFQPLSISPVFPFLKHEQVSTNYIGHLYLDENSSPGGILFLSPWLWSLALLLIPTIRRQLSKARLLLPIVILIGVSVVIASIDAIVAGAFKRYLLDFSFILGIAASLVVLTCYRLLSLPKYQFLKKYFLMGLVGACWWSIVVHFLLYLTEKEEMYIYFWQALMQFWA